MTLFDEIYGTYFQIIERILEASVPNGITYQEMEDIVQRHGYAETTFHLLPKLTSGEWNLLELRNDKYYSKLKNPITQRSYSLLEKQWIKTILQDPRSHLFFTTEDQLELKESLKEFSPLYQEEYFSYFDQAEDGDPYLEDDYKEHFQQILYGIKEEKMLDIYHRTPRGRCDTKVSVYPWKFCFSTKDNKFRLLAGQINEQGNLYPVTINLARICKILPSSHNTSPDAKKQVEKLFRKSNTEVAIFEIKKERNALERCMLHFASYEKETLYQPETDTYECKLTYHISDETELLIQLLSFGPVIKVTSPKRLVNQIKTRISKQISLLGLE